MGGLVPCKDHQIKPHLKPSLLLKFQLLEVISTSWWFKSFQIRFWLFATRRISTVSATIRSSTFRKEAFEGEENYHGLGHTPPQWRQHERCWLIFSPSEKDQEEATHELILLPYPPSPPSVILTHRSNLSGKGVASVNMCMGWGVWVDMTLNSVTSIVKAMLFLYVYIFNKLYI